jgi:hypothetical protein
VRLTPISKLVVLCAVVALVGSWALSGAPAQANSCNITQDRSPSTATAATSIKFVNQSSRTLDIYWLDYNGARVLYWTLSPGQSYDQSTYVGHPWLAVDQDNICRGYVIAGSQAITYTIVDDPVPTPTPTPTPSPSPSPVATSSPSPAPTSPAQPVSDQDHDGLKDAADACPTTPRGAFDANNDGCPGPYRRIATRLRSAWLVDDSGVTLTLAVLKAVPVGATVRVSCAPCHLGQTLTANRGIVRLKKLAGRRLPRGRSFTIMVMKAGYIGQVVTYTVKPYGHTRADWRRAAQEPFSELHRCIPIGSDKPAKQCSATPPTGP